MTLCWLLSEDKAGMEMQCRALAAALGVVAIRKTVVPRAPWKWLPVRAWMATPVAFSFSEQAFAPPWPALVISCGRHAAGVAAAIRRATAGACVAIHIQNPRLPLSCFNLVIAPRHDGLAGQNVIETLGSLHDLDPQVLAREAEAMVNHVAALPRPYITVLVGGSNRHFRFAEDEAIALAADLRKICKASGGSLLVTPSRRTSRDIVAALATGLVGVPHRLWLRHGPNPYRAYLGLADHVVVTADSVNMTTEACATGKPVHIVKLPGRSARLERFHAALEAAGMASTFTGELAEWTYAPLLETPRVAAEITKRLALAGSPLAPAAEAGER